MNRIFFCLKEGIRSIFTHSLSSLLTMVIIVACLLIMGSCGLIAINVSSVIADLETQNPLMAFVQEDLSDEQAREMETALRRVPNVRDVRFVTREEAMDSFLSKLQQSSLFDQLDSSVFRSRYVIYLEDTEIMATTQNLVKDVPGVAWVNAHLGISKGFASTKRVVNMVSGALIVLLFFVCMTIMASALRVTAFERRKEVGIEKMIGATKSFIRGPITVEGVIVGVAGSLLAFILQWLLYTLLEVKLNAAGLSFLKVIPFAEIRMPLFCIFLFLGLLAAVFGSRIAIRNYIRI
jgi:cell division transport system permease protein